MTTAAPDNKLRELEEENELLISQLHLVQEELERYYLKNKELEASASNGHKQASSGSTTVQLKAWVDDELPAALAENARLKTLLEMQQQVRQLETESSLPARMYAALAEVAGTSGKFVRVPKQLLSFWRKENTKAIPSILGGKGHPKVVTAYQNKGMQGAAELLKNNSLSVTQVANAWTDLARHLQETDPKECAKAARHAYEADPKPFRLKWLAFRLNRADKPQEAEAALDLLPANMLLSESEQSSADKIRNKARKEREKQAKKGCQFNARRTEVEKQLKRLTDEKNKLQSEVGQVKKESRRLKTEQSQLSLEAEQANKQLAASQAKMNELTNSRQELTDKLQQRDSSLQQVKTELEVVRVEMNSQLESYSLLALEKTELEKQSIEKEKNLSALNSKLNNSMDELEALKMENSQTRTENKRLEERYKSLEWKFGFLEQENKKKEELVSLQNERFQELQQAIFESKSKCERLEHQQQLMKEEAMRSESQLNTVKMLLPFSNWTEQQQVPSTTQNDSKPDLEDLFKKQTEEIVKARRHLESRLKKEIANAAKQTQAFVGLQSYLATGELPSLNVERQNWPISPDFSFYLAELLEGNRYDLIVEFGSGQSTVLMARILKKLTSRTPKNKKKSMLLVSFDHLEQYCQKTLQQLQQADLYDLVQLHHAPLVDWQGTDGAKQPYYNCQEILAQLASQYPEKNNLCMLVVIDGPPGSTCKHARYPAGPFILEYFKGAQIDFLVDDYIREDEKEVVQRWKDDISATQLSYITRERILEKGACLISVQKVKGKL